MPGTEQEKNYHTVEKKRDGERICKKKKKYSTRCICANVQYVCVCLLPREKNLDGEEARRKVQQIL